MEVVTDRMTDGRLKEEKPPTLVVCCVGVVLCLGGAVGCYGVSIARTEQTLEKPKFYISKKHVKVRAVSNRNIKNDIHLTN